MALPLFDPKFHAKRYRIFMPGLFIAGVCLFILTAFTGEKPDFIDGDAAHYFRYAHSLATEGRMPRSPVIYPCGVSIVGALGYLPSMAATGALHRLGWMEKSELPPGLGLINQFSYCMPFIILSFLALHLNLLCARRLGFSDDSAKPALLFWLAGTNIGYYFLREPAMSESSTYFFVSLYYFLLIKYFYVPGAEGVQTRPSWKASLAPCACLGLALGFASAVRQQNAVHAIAAVPLFWRHARLAFPAGTGGRSAGFLALSATACVAALPFALLPYWAWHASSGKYELFSYGQLDFKFIGPSGFDFLRPHLVATLFSFNYHGIFAWHPMYLLAAAGLAPLLRAHPQLAIALLPPIFLQYYLNASWWCYWFGDTFGHRGFFTIYPILALGFIAGFDFARRRDPKHRLLKVLFGLAALNIVLMLLLGLKVIPAGP